MAEPCNAVHFCCVFLCSPVNVCQLTGHQLDGQPLATPDDCLLAEAIAREDPEVQQMVAARGVSFSKVACDPWAIHACPDDWMGRRLMQVCSTLARCLLCT